MKTLFEIGSVLCFFGSIAALLFGAEYGIFGMLAAIYLHLVAED